MNVTVYTVERCYDYEGCSLEQVYGTRAEADAYVAAQKSEGTCADLNIVEWSVLLPGEESKP